MTSCADLLYRKLYPYSEVLKCHKASKNRASTISLLSTSKIMLPHSNYVILNQNFKLVSQMQAMEKLLMQMCLDTFLIQFINSLQSPASKLTL